MSLVFISALSVLAFLLAFSGLGVLPAAQTALGRASTAGRIMRDPGLSDDIKEREVQKAALGLLASALSISSRSVASLLAAALPIFLFAAFGGPKASAVFAFLSRWDVIAVASLGAIGAMALIARRAPRPTPNTAKDAQNDEAATPTPHATTPRHGAGDAAEPASRGAYSTMDRLLHRVAFATPTLQLGLADAEDSLFRADIGATEDKPPLFITSLPRAGTTVVLNALHDLPGTATHLYRDMPFVMAPLAWSRMAGGFQKDATLTERAHGDGLKVGYDSPEAFEEVIWRAFWPDHFGAERIALWGENDAQAEARAFFKRHFRKIAAVRGRPGARYMSKNNGNIARLDLIPALFSDAQIVVPLRSPAEHAASLHRQHLNFTAQHAADPFVKRYMRDIGHLEFGALHRPIGFAGFDQIKAGFGPKDPSYWLAYWIAAMDTVLARAERLHLLPQERLGTTADTTLNALCRRLGLPTEEADFQAHFRPIASDTDRALFDAALLTRAEDLYADLCRRA